MTQITYNLTFSIFKCLLRFSHKLKLFKLKTKKETIKINRLRLVVCKGKNLTVIFKIFLWTSCVSIKSKQSSDLFQFMVAFREVKQNLLSNVPAADSHLNYFGISASYRINVILIGCVTSCVA